MAKFVWYDLMTNDPKTATVFYSAVMGWQAHKTDVGDVDYTVVSVDGTEIAGIFLPPHHLAKPDIPVAWRGYIYVNDVDAKLQQVTKLGGEICREPWDIATVGRVAVVADPHGACFILFKPCSQEQPQPVALGTPGHVGWHELQSSDWATDFQFYAELFGWTKAEATDMGDIGLYQQFAIDGQPVGGMMKAPCESPRAFWLYYFNVANIDEAAKRVADHGGRVLNGAHQVPGGTWIIHCTDPQGGHFALAGPAIR